jgi:nucleolar protein 12
MKQKNLDIMEQSEPSDTEQAEASDIEQTEPSDTEQTDQSDKDQANAVLNRTIFVGNLPSKLDHRAAAKLFKACGPVESARIRSIVPEKEKLSPKVALITKRIHPKIDSVNAYVVFAKEDCDESVKKALAMNGTIVDGHRIRVDRAQQRNAKRLTLTSRKKSVFVGNLRFDTRDDDLANHFQKVGEVDYVRLVRDRATGLGKGFGFVKFMERAAVKKALELNDTDFKGRKMRVKKVDEKMKLDHDEKKKPFRGTNKNSLPSDEQSADQVQTEKPSDGKSKSGQYQRPSLARVNKNNFIGSKKKKFNRPNLNHKKNNNMKRVRFDLKANKSSNNQQKREAPQFDKVKITKKDRKMKKKTIMKKKIKKESAIS